MRFLKAITKIPVPEILFHDLDADGKVGGEWMIMEYVRPRASLSENIP